jgi:hypothetical protein
MALAARSFTDPEGLQNSALAKRRTPSLGLSPFLIEIFDNSRRGVFPTVSSILTYILFLSIYYDYTK